MILKGDFGFSENGFKFVENATFFDSNMIPKGDSDEVPTFILLSEYHPYDPTFDTPQDVKI